MLIATMFTIPSIWLCSKTELQFFSDRFCWEAKVGQVNVAYDLYARIRQAGANNAV